MIFSSWNVFEMLPPLNRESKEAEALTDCSPSDSSFFPPYFFMPWWLHNLHLFTLGQHCKRLKLAHGGSVTNRAALSTFFYYCTNVLNKWETVLLTGEHRHQHFDQYKLNLFIIAVHGIYFETITSLGRQTIVKTICKATKLIIPRQ